MTRPARHDPGPARPHLTTREAEVMTLLQRHFKVWQDVPSAGTLGRRLGISRQRARAIMASIRDKGFTLRPRG